MNEYKVPQPGANIGVVTELDALHTIKWAVEIKIKFMAQGGTHGYKARIIDHRDVVIDTRRMTGTVIDTDAMAVLSISISRYSHALSRRDGREGQLLTLACDRC